MSQRHLLNSRILANFKQPKGFSEDDERLNVVGECIEQTDFDTLKENNWFNNKVRKKDSFSPFPEDSNL